jgi:hypothetical protein
MFKLAFPKRSRSPFKGRDMVIATMHGKDLVIGPVFEKKLGVIPFLPQDFNTDEFGTFSGEKERQQDALNTCRQKCLRAMELTGANLGIASEGSFGPHPEIFCVPADEEVIVFIDKEQDIEVHARMLSTATNFNRQYVKSWDELQAFAKAAIFPTHSLILRASGRDADCIYKGIGSPERLEHYFEELLNTFGGAWVETDMRAHHNPSRMKVIEQVTLQLLANLESCCPQCNSPGFSIKRVERGLPCKRCSSATHSVSAHVYACSKCNYEQVNSYPDGQLTEDPMFCDSCNP